MIRGVILDCGGVLYGRRGPSGAKELRNMLESHYGIPRGSLKKTLELARAAAAQGAHDASANVLDDAHRRLVELAGQNLPRLHRELRREKREASALLVENIELVRALRPAYKVGVLANSNGTIEARLEAWNIRGIFDAVLDSRVIGVEKPDPRAYEYAADALEISPTECVFIDNNEPNVEAARALGMTALLFDAARGDDLAAMLAALGVVPASSQEAPEALDIRPRPAGQP